MKYKLIKNGLNAQMQQKKCVKLPAIKELNQKA
jgi:hypothetical protein